MITDKSVISIIRDMYPTTEISSDTQLLAEGILDSLGIMNLSIKLKEIYKVEINIFDITPENYSTPITIAEMINKKSQ